ncbi:UNVERIFIED_CONTAM: hypothetical protein Sindi_1667800 [Sesamum indicum]
MDRTIWGRSNDAMLRTIQGATTTPFLPRILRPAMRNVLPSVRRIEITETTSNCPDPVPTNSLVGGGKVADFVSNSNHVAIVDKMGVDSVNVDLFTNDVVKCVADRKKETCVDVVNGDSVNNDYINIDLVNNVVNVDMDNYRGKETCVEVVKGDLVNNDEINIDLVNVAVHVDMVNEEDSVDTIKDAAKIPLQTSSDPVVDDKIADAFNNSSPRRWESTVVGYFLGKRPYFYHVQKFALSAWPGLREVKATSNGFYFFQFKTIAYMEEAIEGGLWLFHGQSIVLQKWESGMAMRKLKHTQVPVWIRLRHLPVELWTVEGLSTVASGIGRPLYPDAITRPCTRLDFPRVCVMLDVSSKLPKHIIIMMPKEEGGEITCTIDVEYEWLPPKCTSCMTLGHTTKVCAFTKPSNPAKPPVSVYVPKTIPARPPPMQPTQGMDKQREGRELPHGEDQERITPTQGVDNQRKGREHELPTQEEDSQREGRERPRERRLSREEKGKAIAMYNTFDALQLLDDAEDTPRGHIPR